MSDRRPGPPLPGFVGRALEPLYALAVARRNRRYDRGRGTVTLDRPVISVGNLSVGGTGKTPMVIHLVRWLISAGRRPCIAMRGYGSARTPGGISDEAAQYQNELGNVPVVAGADRVDGLIRLFATPAGERVDCVVLDDGFQHRKISRQLEVVMIDATRDPFRDRLLPAGWLREPVRSLERARWVVLSHAEASAPGAVYQMGAAIRAIDAGIRVAVTRHTWTELFIETRDGIEVAEVAWLRARNVLAVCGLGNPAPFLAAVEKAVGGRTVDRIVMGDHAPYRDPAIRRVLDAAKGKDAVVTTAKDWTKLVREPIGHWPCPVVRPHLELAFDAGREDLEREVLAAASRPPP